MPSKLSWILVALIAGLTLQARAQEADFTLQVWGDFDTATLAEFAKRVEAYDSLRRRLEVGLTPLAVTTNPDEIIQAERALAHRIREARESARRGDILIPALQTELKKFLVLQVDEATLDLITGDNPGELRIKVNGSYPKEMPVSTVPPKLLLQLPSLPADLQFRFVGRHLILLDVRANIVVDEMPYAITCVQCGTLITGERE
jgi:hypothetical protein